jgi:hypothetical protein
MKRTLLLIIPLTLALLAGCTGSKMLYKKGEKLHEAGMYAEAADYFYNALVKKGTNTKAQIGLKETGQMVLNDQLAQFYKEYGQENHKAAVYAYKAASEYHQKVERVGVYLNFPTHYETYFDESKEIYLSERYDEAQEALNEERFSDAEAIISEILYIDADYADAKDLKQYASLEPKYRQGKEDLRDRKYRRAYYIFDELQTNYGGYKDSEDLRSFAQEKGAYTVAFLPFKNSSEEDGYEKVISSEIIQALLTSNDPFIKIIDREHLQILLQEQHLGLSGVVDEPTAAKAGNIVGAKAVFVGQLVSMDQNEGRLLRYTRKGYHAYSVKKRNPETGQYFTETTYEKVNYLEYEKKNTVSLSFQFKLISSETGEILLTDVVNLSDMDEVHYATYSGNYKYLYPGTWKHKEKEHASDKVITSSSEKNKLNRLFKADTSPRTVKDLLEDLTENVGQKVSRQVLSYDPEA